ncbi:MAG: YfhO family protein [Actinobacteria bacterium]|nr:YfhO family protein [Actinomycetota bacterium]MCL5446282.1 YfhO family protein [Actinomycetota bacterium]
MAPLPPVSRLSVPDGANQGLHRNDLLAIGIIALVSIAYFYPALDHGTVYGSMDLLTLFPVTHGLFNHVHNLFSSDQVREESPWLAFNWHSIHSGVLPLWNRYTLLGMPQMFNFQSAVFSLPHLISYLFPVSLGYGISVLAALFIAGTGAYAAARILGAGAAGALVGAVTFELSGSLVNWIGWPPAQVNAWLGWIVFFSILTYRSKRTAGPMVGLALSVAFALWAGHPDSYVLDGFTVLLLGGSIVSFKLMRRQLDRHIFRLRVAKILIGGLLGGMLAAPMLLPAMQLVHGTARNLARMHHYGGLPPNVAVNFITAGYYGYPITSSRWFYGSNFYELSACVGPVALALAIFAFIRMIKRPVIAGMSTSALVLVAVIFHVSPLQRVISALPYGTVISFNRLLMPLDFLIAILAALGFTRLIRSPSYARLSAGEDGMLRRHARADSHIFTIICGSIAAVLVWLYVRTEMLGTLISQEKSIRLGSLDWSIGSLALGFIFLLGWLYLFRISQPSYDLEKSPEQAGGEQPVEWDSKQYQNNREEILVRGDMPICNSPGKPPARLRRPSIGTSTGKLFNWNRTSFNWNSTLWPALILPSLAVLAVLASQIMLLLPPAAEAASYSHRFFPSDPTVQTLKAIVGDHLMGDGPPPPGDVSQRTPISPSRTNAFSPETNMPYGIALFGAYDPMLQAEYISSWNAAAMPRTPVPLPPGGTFMPSFPNAALARLYGVRYLLTVRDSQGKTEAPSGADRVLAEPGFTLYEVPGAHRFTLVEPDLNDVVYNAEQDSSIYGRVTSWKWTSDNHLVVMAASNRRSELLARITDVPGWHASVNGHAVPVERAAGTMLAIPLPAGKDTVDLTYWPAALTAGIIAAILAIMVIVTLVIIGIRSYRSKSSQTAPYFLY